MGNPNIIVCKKDGNKVTAHALMDALSPQFDAALVNEYTKQISQPNYRKAPPQVLQNVREAHQNAIDISFVSGTIISGNPLWKGDPVIVKSTKVIQPAQDGENFQFTVSNKVKEDLSDYMYKLEGDFIFLIDEKTCALTLTESHTPKKIEPNTNYGQNILAGPPSKPKHFIMDMFER